MQKESPSQLPHGGVRTPRQQLQDPLVGSPEVAQLVGLLTGMAGRLDGVEEQLKAFGPIEPGLTRAEALKKARTFVSRWAKGMPAGARLNAELEVARFLVGEHAHG